MQAALANLWICHRPAPRRARGARPRRHRKINVGLAPCSQNPGTNRDLVTVTTAGEGREPPLAIAPLWLLSPPPQTPYPGSAAPRQSRRSSCGHRRRACSWGCRAPCPGSCARWAGTETPCSGDLQDSERQSRHRRASTVALQPHRPEGTPKAWRERTTPRPVAPPWLSSSDHHPRDVVSRSGIAAESSMGRSGGSGTPPSPGRSRERFCSSQEQASTAPGASVCTRFDSVRPDSC